MSLLVVIGILGGNGVTPREPIVIILQTSNLSRESHVACAPFICPAFKGREILIISAKCMDFFWLSIYKFTQGGDLKISVALTLRKTNTV